MTAEVAEKAIGQIDLSMIHAPRAEIVKRLAVLRVTTASRNMGDVDTELLLEAYSQALQSFPADIVLSVLGKRRQWFPTLQELEDECAAAGEKRAALRSAIERSQVVAIATPEPERSPEERAKVAALFAGLAKSIGPQKETAPFISPDDELELIASQPLRVSNASAIIERIGR